MAVIRKSYSDFIFNLVELFKSCIATETEVDPEGIQDEDEIEEEDDDEVSQDDQGRILENCYLAMVDALAKQVHELVLSVLLRASFSWLSNFELLNTGLTAHQYYQLVFTSFEVI